MLTNVLNSIRCVHFCRIPTKFHKVTKKLTDFGQKINLFNIFSLIKIFWRIWISEFEKLKLVELTHHVIVIDNFRHFVTLVMFPT